MAAPSFFPQAHFSCLYISLKHFLFVWYSLFLFSVFTDTWYLCFVRWALQRHRPDVPHLPAALLSTGNGAKRCVGAFTGDHAVLAIRLQKGPGDPGVRWICAWKQCHVKNEWKNGKYSKLGEQKVGWGWQAAWGPSQQNSLQSGET